MKIKVLHLTSTRYGIGGVEKLLLDMADKYDTSRFEVSFCNLFCDKNGKGVFPTTIKERGLNYFEIRGKRWFEVPRMIFDLFTLIKKQKFQIVHLHMLKATIVGGFATMFVRQTKSVLTKHYTDKLSNHSIFIKKLDNYFTRHSDQIAAISHYVKEDMAKLGVPEEKIRVIFNGTDLSLFDKKAVEEFDLPQIDTDSPLIIGTVGSLTERKGHRFLLFAIKLLQQKHPDLHLIVLGEGPEQESLERIIFETEIGESVTLLGFRNNVAAFLKKIDLYIHPSLHEPFGISIIEAMAAQKCVIATAVDGVPEIIKDGKNGILIPPGDAAKLAEAMSGVLGDHPELERLGKAARKTVETNFNIEKTVAEYQDLYLSVV